MLISIFVSCFELVSLANFVFIGMFAIFIYRVKGLYYSVFLMIIVEEFDIIVFELNRNRFNERGNMSKYHMRRQDRLIIDTDEIKEILKQGKYATIAMVNGDKPYVVTLSYGFDSASKLLYFHTGPEGHKIDCLKTNANVCATIIDDCGYLNGECGHKFRTLIINGAMVFVDSHKEKRYGMNVILEHLEDAPSKIKEKAVSSAAMYEKIAVLKLGIEDITGKKGQ